MFGSASQTKPSQNRTVLFPDSHHKVWILWPGSGDAHLWYQYLGGKGKQISEFETRLLYRARSRIIIINYGLLSYLCSSFIWFLSHYLPSNPLTIGRRERRLEGRRSIDIDLFRLLLPAVRGVRFLGASPVSPNSNPANQQFSKCNSSGSSCLWPFQGSQFIPFPEFPELNHLQLAKIMPLLEHETIIVNGFRQTEAGPYPTPGI